MRRRLTQGLGAAALAAALVVAVIRLLRAEPGAAADLQIFTSAPLGLTLRYPADLAPRDTFTPNSFDRGAWRVSYAADVGPGMRIVAFALPSLHASDAGGDSEASAELRIGVSRDPDVVASCLTYGMNSGDNIASDTRTLGGVVFIEVPDNGDGGLQQRISSDDLRAVHDGACYAIDLVQFVGGTSNKRPAHTAAQLAELRGILATIRLHPAEPTPSSHN